MHHRLQVETYIEVKFILVSIGMDSGSWTASRTPARSSRASFVELAHAVPVACSLQVNQMTLVCRCLAYSTSCRPPCLRDRASQGDSLKSTLYYRGLVSTKRLSSFA